MAAETPEAVIAEAASALEAFLASYVERGEAFPLPQTLKIRHERPESYEVRLRDLDPQPA